jgi:glutamine amidotransferase
MALAGHDRTVGIVAYQAGNIRSLESAFEHIGARVVRVRERGDMDACTHVVLPGVGAFGFCAQRLQDSHLTPALEAWALEQRRPLLGICVGMQLLGDRSEESPAATGLGWIGGEITRLTVHEGVRVPHVGWNSVHFRHAAAGFAAGDEADFYFDHSFAYGAPTRGSVLGECRHGRRFSAIVARDNITAVQFHPEKSQTAGLRFLSGFLAQ